nr:MaoC family dehydratase [Natronococcus pandeyae]
MNRAVLSSFLLESTREDKPPDIDSNAFEQQGWKFERSVDDPDNITVGDTVTFSKVLDEEDVRAFACVTGDTNRLHLDDAYATETRFGGRIVHGTLVAGLISAALARLPGLTIYLAQDLEFLHPVRIGDRVSSRVEVRELIGGDQYRLSTTINAEDRDTALVDGEAVVIIGDAPELSSDDRLL